MKRIAVVANARSGTASKLGRAALEDLVRGALGARLAGLQIVEPAAVKTALQRAFGDAPEAVAVIGGDGTCRGAAEIARATGIPVIFLPGGTMNLLPKRIWGEMDLKTALETIGRGETAPVKLDIAEIGGQLFLVAAMFGAAPRLTQFRENLRRTRSLREIGRVGAEAARSLRALMRPTVRIVEPAGLSETMPALMVTPGSAENAFAKEAAAAPSTPSLECVAATVKGLPGLIVVTLRVLFGANWRSDSRLVAFNAPQVKVGTRGRRLRVTLDGEIALAPNPATISFLPAELATLGPSAPAESPPEPKTAAAV